LPISSGEPRRFSRAPRLLLSIRLLPLLLLLGPEVQAASPSGRTTLVLLSLDGFRYDYPDRSRGGAFERLEGEGVRAERLIPPFPASTFPAHASLATGCYPERHGILNSRFLDATRGDYDRSEDPDWLACEPIWITAERQGAPSAVLNWLASYGKWRGVEPSHHNDRFAALTDRESIQRTLEWLRLPPGSRPRFVAAYLSGVDHAGHAQGPRSEAVDRRIHSVDRLLDSFLHDLRALPFAESIQLIIVADHGMASREGWIDPGEALRAKRIPYRLLASGGAANLYLRRPGDRMRALAALEKIPGLEAFPGDRLPEELHYSFPGRTGDLVLLAPVGIELGRHGDAEAEGGVHGYRGEVPEMGGIFYAQGTEFQKGVRIPSIRAIDVYSVACAVLGILPSRNAQGKIPPGLLRNPDPKRAPHPRPRPEVHGPARP
jgi:predicted AlkP superfamily pyrophosphatase or phosphodiesterase